MPTSTCGAVDLVRLASFGGATSEAQWIAQESKSLLDSGRASSVALLYRCGKQRALLADAIHAIDPSLIGENPLKRAVETEECRDLLAYAALALNSSDSAAFCRAVTAPVRGVGRRSRQLLLDAAEKKKTTVMSVCKGVARGHGAPGIPPKTCENLRRVLGPFVNSVEALAKASREGEAIGPALRRLLGDVEYQQHIGKRHPDDERKRWAALEGAIGMIEDVVDRDSERHSVRSMDVRAVEAPLTLTHLHAPSTGPQAESGERGTALERLFDLNEVGGRGCLASEQSSGVVHPRRVSLLTMVRKRLPFLPLLLRLPHHP